MKHFLSLPALLRTASFLASAAAASQQHSSFSVHDDVLAFPQYEVRFFEEEWLSEEQARVKLAKSGGQAEEELREPGYQLQQRLRKSHDEDDDGRTIEGEREQVDYEEMKLAEGEKWLCRVPKIKKREDTSSFNETTSRAEEEKELARASDRGWELLSGMQDTCIYFIGGWWSYQFCYNQGVRQFHQLPPARGIPNWPPQEDPGVPGFMLGVYDSDKVVEVDDDHEEGKEEGKWEGGSGLAKSGDSKRLRGGSGELVQRGESRYLTQTLGGGTRCDLTGKHRKIEVQYHCNPLGGERISLIKEQATCTYLMVIQTPRLCNDVAFQPPQKDQPNIVSCYPVLKEEEIEDYKQDLADLREAERLLRQEAATFSNLDAGSMGGLPPPNVGDVVVGMHRLVPEGRKIEKSAIVGGGKEIYIDTLASSDGSKTFTPEDLKRLGLGDAKAIENLKKQIEKVAQGEQWKLDVVDTVRGREYRGIVGGDDEDEEGEVVREKEGEGRGRKGEGSGKKVEDGGKEGGQRGEKKQKGEKKKEKKEKKQQQQQGSEEEYFKEEL